MKSLDERIISAFALRGHQSSKALAIETGVAERTVRRHVNDMMDKGVLSLVVIPDPVVCGMKAWTKIGIKAEPSLMQDVARILVKHPSIYFVAQCLGRFDFIVAAHFDSLSRLEHCVNSELAGTHGVTASETWMLASPRRYYGFRWPAPVDAPAEDSPDAPTEDSPAHRLTPVDHSILALLWEDGRASIAEVSSRLGKPQDTVRRRMHEMFNAGICKREVVMSASTLGNQIWASIGLSTRGRNVHEMIDKILLYPAVYLASSSLGRFNIVLGVRFRSMDLLNRFVMVDLPSIDGISSTETFVHNKPLKYHNVVVKPE